MGFVLPWVAVGIAGVVLYNLRWPMSARVRRQAPGSFVKLSRGVVHYQWHGDENDPVIVLVHGLTTPSFVWRDMVPQLVQAGYRVLTFDHFGRGFSDRPWARYDMDFYVAEMDELLAALDVQKPFDLLGYSMGGGIVTAYAGARTADIRKLILIAPVGFLPVSGAQKTWVARWPVVGDFFMFLFGGIALRRGMVRDGMAENVDAEMIDLQCRETKFAGFLGAVLSSVRHVIYMDQTAEHKYLADQGKPMLAVFAVDDTTIPLVGAAALEGINPQAKIIQIDDAGHALVTTHAHQTNDVIVQFLADQEM